MSFNLPPLPPPYLNGFRTPSLPQPPLQQGTMSTPYATIAPYSFPANTSVALDSSPKPFQTLMEFSYSPVFPNNPNEPSQLALTYRFPPFVPLPPKGSILETVWVNDVGGPYPAIMAKLPPTSPALVPASPYAGFNMTA